MSSHPARVRSVAFLAHDPRRNERGMALIFALFFAVVALGITLSGTIFVKAHRDATSIRFASNSQAVEFARSGLIEAIGWFRKQTAQPVTTFAPQFAPTATPPSFDTIDPEIGIVREFEISGAIWGRYEVWKTWAADPDADRLAFRTQLQCEDISDQRGNLSPGSVWRLRSIGYVFRRTDPSARFDAEPNRVIAKELVETEIRRLALQPPGQAALCTRTASTCRINTRGRIYGGTNAAGIYVKSGTGSVTVSGTGATVTGGISPNANYDDSMTAVFGVTLAELQGMADAVIVNPAEFPSPLPDTSVVVADTDLTFDATRPLTGTGILVVNGDVTIQPSSYSSFSGLLYVNGNLTVREPCEMQGSIVVTGAVTVQGSTSDFATITFDDGIVARLRQTLGTYRQATSTTRPFWGDQR